MQAFRSYVSELERLTSRLLKGVDTLHPNRIVPILNGEVSEKLRCFVPLQERRAAGAFFTGHRLAQHITRQMVPKASPGPVIADISCGAGDLLLACAKRLPLGGNLAETLSLWGRKLMGVDIHPEFVRVAKIRLTLLAITQHPHEEFPLNKNLNSFFPRIRCGDFLSSPEEVAKASHIVINPPYNDMVTLPGCTWANGSVSAASVFMDVCVSNATPGTYISAILPDVLRSGSSYQRWRDRLESLSSEISINKYGQFDKWADVDVFTVCLKVGTHHKKRKATWQKLIRKPCSGLVGDHFNVHVGPVVPHRHAKKGPSLAYVHAKILPQWGTVNRINERRKFNGTLFQPPLVLVRRTSRPGNNRAISTIVTGKRKIAVENHLLALLPRDKTIAQCKQLLRVLQSSQTDKWLDSRIRCRHLTVGVLKDIPWWRV